MKKERKIPIHRMDDWFSGVYVKLIGKKNIHHPSYEMSQPHRHDFYYCVLLDKGEMELEVDFATVQLSDRCIFLSYPGQIHRIVSARMERGWFLAFDPAILDVNLRNILDQCLSEVILVPLSPEASSTFYSFIGHLYLVYKDRSQLFGQQAIQSMVSAFIFQFASAYLPKERSVLSSHSARTIEITKIFRQMLRHYARSMKRTSQFAAKMNMTASYLNDTVKLVTGFPVTYHIQQELMLEARRLLYYSDHPIKEIAGELGFDDVKYFTRLFSKVTGVSPGAYRQQQALNINK